MSDAMKEGIPLSKNGNPKGLKQSNQFSSLQSLPEEQEIDSTAVDVPLGVQTPDNIPPQGLTEIDRAKNAQSNKILTSTVEDATIVSPKVVTSSPSNQPENIIQPTTSALMTSQPENFNVGGISTPTSTSKDVTNQLENFTHTEPTIQALLTEALKVKAQSRLKKTTISTNGENISTVSSSQAVNGSANLTPSVVKSNKQKSKIEEIFPPSFMFESHVLSPQENEFSIQQQKQGKGRKKKQKAQSASTLDAKNPKTAATNTGSSKLPAGLSDHSPLEVSIKPDFPTGPRPFKYFQAWEHHPQFSELITKTWQHCVRGNPMFQLAMKLKHLKTVLKAWNKDIFGSVQGSLQHSRQVLEAAQTAVLQSPSNRQLLIQEAAAKEGYLSSLKREESFLRQKSRQLWLAEGDRNSKFFYSSIKARIARNTLRKVVFEDGTESSNPNIIKDYAVNYYQRLLNVHNPHPIPSYNSTFTLTAHEGSVKKLVVNIMPSVGRKSALQRSREA
ncbi:hypothetical protein QJS10_CPA09g00579 [Acorus calamus]|uniref:Uncharacterized protein n=1 Tax=Acorus calamus TaxID=4465 RepID=A0AAV9E354_ACOCL|nr:hypothetical protein QJS10_CPA09g00579 [Acorus calamus]